jgi:hypothetical protein
MLVLLIMTLLKLWDIISNFSVLRQRTHALAHSLVGWLSGRLDLYLRPCGRARGVAGVGAF